MVEWNFGFVALLVVLVTAGMPVGAGTAYDPEVTDPLGDTFDFFLGMPDTSPGTEELDLVAAWFGETRSAYAITFEVADLSADGALRTGRNVQGWRAQFDAHGYSFDAEVLRAADGSSRGLVSLVGAFDGNGQPRSNEGTASVSFDASRDQISLTLPRAWSVETPEGYQVFTFADGTLLTNIFIESFDGIGDGASCLSCTPLDRSEADATEDFEFEDPCRGVEKDIDHRTYAITGPDHAPVSTSDMTGDVVQGDTVEVTFYVDRACAHVNLVSYKAPNATWEPEYAHMQRIYDVEGGFLERGTHTLTVQVPDCTFQVDFVIGEAITHFDPANGTQYSKQGRLMDAANGGIDDCSFGPEDLPDGPGGILDPRFSYVVGRFHVCVQLAPDYPSGVC